MAWESGQKTKSSILWLSDEDVFAFSHALAMVAPDIPWQCSHVGADRETSHAYPNLKKALECSLGEHNNFVRQACALLPFGQSKVLGGLFFNWTCKYPETVVPARNFGPVDVSAYPRKFMSVKSSSLAIRWNTSGEDEAVCEAISSQVKLIWKTLNKVTFAVKCRSLINNAEYSTSRFRIGPDMKTQVQREGWCIQDGQFYVLV